MNTAAPVVMAGTLGDELFITGMTRALRHLPLALVENRLQRALAYAAAFPAPADDARLARLDRRALAAARLDPLRRRIRERNAA